MTVVVIPDDWIAVTVGDDLSVYGTSEAIDRVMSEIEDCDDCESCKGTGTISWFDHAEGAWRDKHCTDCDGKGVKFTVRKASDPDVIYLSPSCTGCNAYEGRLWCVDNEGPCEECGKEWVEYHRKR